MNEIVQYQEQDECENLSGNDIFECQRWIEEMHSVAVGIEIGDIEYMKRMNLTKENQNG